MLIAGFEIRLKHRTCILIAVGVWCLMVVILVNSYAAMLLSFQSVTKLEPAIGSLEELAKLMHGSYARIHVNNFFCNGYHFL